MEDEEKSGRGFKVEDRRRFSASGETREADAPEEPTPPRDAPAEPTRTPPHLAEPAPPREAPGSAAFAELTFSTFVIGLSTQALVLLGEMPDPSSRALATDLPGAKQLIDILGILEAKTRGNLDEAEAGLLGDILYDLRMRYVQRSRGA